MRWKEPFARNLPKILSGTRRMARMLRRRPLKKFHSSSARRNCSKSFRAVPLPLRYLLISRLQFNRTGQSFLGFFGQTAQTGMLRAAQLALDAPTGAEEADADSGFRPTVRAR